MTRREQDTDEAGRGQRKTDASAAGSVGGAGPATAPRPRVPRWAVRIETLLEDAAKTAVEEGIPLEAFVLAAHAAYLRADPETAERLANLVVLAQVEELRRRGRLPLA